MELQDLQFALLGCCLALVQYFLSVAQFLPFGMAMYILCHCMWEARNLLSDFTASVTVKRLTDLSFRTDLNFELKKYGVLSHH